MRNPATSEIDACVHFNVSFPSVSTMLRLVALGGAVLSGASSFIVALAFSDT